jgi:hypothetical protein
MLLILPLLLLLLFLPPHWMAVLFKPTQPCIADGQIYLFYFRFSLNFRAGGGKFINAGSVR